MNKFIATLIFISLFLVSCGTSKSTPKKASLEGTWELYYITGPKIAFNGLFPDKKPTIVFNLTEKKVAGNNSCNKYFGTLLLDGDKINFKDAKLGMTMMACNGNGDATYMEALNKVETYTITDDGNTLNFLLGNVVIMRFRLQK